MSAAKGKRWKIVLVSVVLFAALVVGVGMTRGLVVDTTVGNRKIVGETANIFTGGRLSHDGTTATLQLGGSSSLGAQVTPEAVVLGDGTSLPIPAGCHEVKLKAMDQRLHVSFDGVSAN